MSICSLRWLPAVAGLVLFAACSSGVESGADDSGFVECADRAGLSLVDSGDWDTERQQAFWSEPGALDCAVDELEPDQREEALSEGFPDWSEFEGADFSRAADRQWTLLADYATSVADESSVEEALQRASVVMGSLFVADADSPDFARGMVDAVVLSVLRDEGDLPGYESYLAAQPEAEHGAPLLVAWRNLPPEEGPSKAEDELIDPLVDGLLTTVRG